MKDKKLNADTKPQKKKTLDILGQWKAQNDENVSLLDYARQVCWRRTERRWKRAQEVEDDIAARRAKVLLKEQIELLDFNPAPPRKGDMTFWVTRVGEKPKIRTPEEEKGSRKISMTQYAYELNPFRAHARQGFIYWPKGDFGK